MIFELLRQKWCRIMYKFRQNTISGPETCQIGQKVGNRTCPDLSRRTSTYFKPSEILLFFQILQVLTSNHRKYFYFFRFYTFPFFMTSTYFKTAEILFFWDFTPFHFLLAIFSFFIKSHVFINKFIFFYKIMCFY